MRCVTVKPLLTVLAFVLMAAPKGNAQQAGDLTSLQPSLTNSVVTIKASKTPLTYYSCYNPNGSEVYVQFFDKATSATVTIGTTSANRVVIAPALSNNRAQELRPPFAAKNGLQVAATTSPNGSMAPAGPIHCEFGYR
jgi:hypothetical protein